MHMNTNTEKKKKKNTNEFNVDRHNKPLLKGKLPSY